MKKAMVALLVFIIATLEFFAENKKLLDSKGPFGGIVFRYIFLLFYCFGRSVEFCEIVYRNIFCLQYAEVPAKKKHATLFCCKTEVRTFIVAALL